MTPHRTLTRTSDGWSMVGHSDDQPCLTSHVVQVWREEGPKTRMYLLCDALVLLFLA